MPVSSPPKQNPIYFFVKDIINQKEKSDKPLREIAHQRWQELPAPAMVLFECIQPASDSDKGTCSSPDSGTSPTYEHTSAESSLDRDVQRLNALFGDHPKEAMFIVASSNVFVHRPALCIPAEIGFVKFSLNDGIIDSLHSMVEPGPVPLEFVLDAILACDDYHRIPHEGKRYPNMAVMLRAVHSMLHSASCTTTTIAPATDDNVHCGIAWIAIEDDEFEQTCAVLEHLANESRKLDLGLEWNMHYMKLSSVWQYMRVHLMESPLDTDEFAFKTSVYDYLDLCSHHDKNDCAHCALSKAHRGCYILANEFCPKFHIDRVPGRHGPLKSYVKHF